ncbi:PhzF family phenazine biosynthesis protein [Rhizomicrobium electricum]|uniref:PhzF family phenazine biosynthesis protein n=1 Tax=Rhizomicrobium electricum TaxID=480070 RepID=A0ABP3PI49_9PROT|nr:PhzF family phenazine biosynthesis protein [Rhizomicrobium electricum]NIJ47185.1 PhzF family phenazine biosynthesis protein [Rhizomicrobium electricum]
MHLKLWQIDAFANKPLEGNPAAVVPLETWLEAELMQAIARENNLSETAFFVKTGDGRYDLRWFTPRGEVDLCGHATLGSAAVLFEELEPALNSVRFATRSGELVVTRGADGLTMTLPSDPPAPFAAPSGYAEAIGEALGTIPPRELFAARYLVGVWDDPKTIRDMKGCGEIAALLRQQNFWGMAVTAAGDENYDFVSRFFAPDKGVPEDPVTGSSHTILTPFWAERLGKKTMKARQVSPRGGDLTVTDDGARTVLAGKCALYMKGEIFV